MKELTGQNFEQSRDDYYCAEYFIKRKKEMETIFNTIKPELVELGEYFLPRSAQFLNKKRPSNVKSRKIVDSTPLIALRNFSSGMMTGATNPTNRWFKTSFRNDILNNDYYLKNWAANQEELTRKILYSSNFYQCLPEIYKELAVFGFSAVSLESDFENVVNFKVLPVGSYYFAHDEKGRVDTFCITYTESVKNIIKMFPLTAPDEIKEANKNNPFKEYEIIHFVERNKYFKPRHLSSKFAPFVSVVILANKNTLLSVKGFNKFPFVVFESSSVSNADYPANSIGMEALADVKQLMTMVREYAKAVKKIVTPTYKGPSSLKNKKLADVPGAFIEEDENGRGISPIYEVNPRILELKAEKDELKEAIKLHFYNDLFAMILSTAQRGRTATEVNELKEEKMVLLSPLLEQVHQALRQILNWIYDEQLRLGIIEPLKKEYEGRHFEIEFVSSLAQAQRVSNISSIERFTTFVANIASSIDPTLKSKLNGEKIIEDYANFANISPTQIISSYDLEKIREENKKASILKEQLYAFKEGSQIIQNMGGVDSYGSELLQRFGII